MKKNKNPMNYKRNKSIKAAPNKTRRRALTILYVGLGMNLFGFAAFDPLGSFIENLGLLIMAVGVGFMAGGYFLLNSGEEITEAVEDFEGR